MRTIKFRVWDTSNGAWIDGVDISPDGSIKAWSEDEPSDDFILCEWTGLKDKNGKEIYEGDVLATKNNVGFEHRDTIELGWSRDSRYGFMWSKSKNTVLEQDTIDERYEVIGNIYENPELIPNGKDE